MTTIYFKNATGVEWMNEVSNLSERLHELERYERMRRQESEANPETMTTGKDITVANEIAAIHALYAEEKKRDFLTPVVEGIIAEGAEDRRDALEVIANQTNKGCWAFAEKYDALDLDRSSEEFMIQFMSAYNKEIGCRY